MIRKFTGVLILSLFFLIGFIPVTVTQSRSQPRIDTDFFQSIQSSSSEEIIIIKFRNPNAVEQAWNQASIQNKQLDQNTVVQDFDENYIQQLVSFQKNWFNKTSTSIPMTLIHTYQHVYNGVAVKIRGYYIPLLLKDSSVERIFDTRDTNYLFRGHEINTLSVKKTWDLVDQKKETITGKGIRVGILDTGIDYYHTDFSPLLYATDKEGKQIVNPLSKIKGGKDFADGDADFMDSGKNENGSYPPHGTHVAGITSGNNPNDPVRKGMAPDSDLYIYKVFSDNSQGANPANIIAAANQSVIDKCHIINLSLGNATPTASIQPGEPYYDALVNAIKSGVVVVIAAGNDGSRAKANPYPIHAPGIFDKVIQVAGTDDRMHFGIHIKFPDGSVTRVSSYKFPYTPPFKTEFNGLPIVDCGYGRPEDFSGVNVKGKIAFISRGPKEKGITFREKNLNAANAGAIAAITYNYDPVSLSGTLIQAVEDQKLPFIPNLQLSGYHAGKIKEALVSGGSVEFPNQNVGLYEMSSAGPCFSGNDNVFKPEVSAPGQQVNSAVMSKYNAATNEYDPQYEDWDGTSMATPGASGAIALVRQARPDWSPVDIKNVVMNTADIVINQVSGQPFSFFNQGSGQINALSASTAPIITSPPSFMHNIEDIPEGNQFEIKNVSEKEVKVSVSSEVFRISNDENPLTVKLNTSALTIPAKGSLCFSVDFLIDKERFTMRTLEGVIWIKILNAKDVGSKSTAHHIPYILYKDKVTDIDPPISDFKISDPVIDMTGGSKYTVNFSINTGSHLVIKGAPPEVDAYSNLVNDFRVYIVDKKNNRWGDIYFSENFYVGNYSFEWNGKDIYGNEIVPDGKFFMVAESSGTKITVKGSDVTREPLPEISATIPLTFVNSSIPVPPIFLISCPSKIKVGADFTIDILFADVKNINQIELEINYSKSNTSLVEYQLGEFIDMKQFNEKKDIKVEDGSFTIKATKDPENAKSRMKIASITLRADKATSKLGMKFELTHFVVKDDQEKDIQSMIDYPTIFIIKEEVMLGDFDGNSFIDNADLQLLMEAYNSDYLDDNWNPLFDLNNDYLVNIADIAIFAQAFEAELVD
ncbi:MAG: S8 family serine peptidase [Caldisericia bacterium]|nr:S8 family serine peptidase [Caldisericia bacterium]